MLFGLYGNYVLHAKDTSPPPSGISPEKVAEYVHAVLEADRTIYTNHVVNRMQAKGIVSATEHWENENALPLPAQFLQHSGKLVAESGRGIRYRLISLWPVYQRNAPATEFERKALDTLTQHADRPVTGVVTSGRNNTFKRSTQIGPFRPPVSTATITIPSVRSETSKSTTSWAAWRSRFHSTSRQLPSKPKQLGGTPDEGSPLGTPDEAHYFTQVYLSSSS